jgi:hypothetical protein
VALYHMVGSDLRSAGWQESARHGADGTDVTLNIESASPFFPLIRNT